MIAHLGMPEVEAFSTSPSASRRAPGHHDDVRRLLRPRPAAGRPAARLLALQDRIVFGSDFPNIPYPYAHQVEALDRLGLGDDWMRAVLWDNGTALFGPVDP